jgi:hypothetical protein
LAPKEWVELNILVFSFKLTKINRFTACLYVLSSFTGILIPILIVALPDNQLAQIIPGLILLFAICAIYVIYRPLKTLFENIIVISCYTCVSVVHIIGVQISTASHNKFSESQKTLSQSGSTLIYICFIFLLGVFVLSIKPVIDTIKDIKQENKRIKEHVKREKMKIEAQGESM